MRKPASLDPSRAVTLPQEWMWWDEVVALSLGARWHFLALITHCADLRDYDGEISVNRARNLIADPVHCDETLAELATAGFVEIQDGDLRIVDVEQFMPPRAIVERQTSHCLYRLFGADGELLYIGRTWNVKQRLQEHARVQPWWSEVASHTVERLSSLDALCNAEANAIARESPRYNLVRHEWRAAARTAS